MPSTSSDKFRALLAQENWDELIPVLVRLDPSVAADFFTEIPADQQETLFRSLPIDFAARLAELLPYYDAFVLLHTRSSTDLTAIVDRMNPAQRVRFFEELPEELWQVLMNELAKDEPARGEPAAPAGLPPSEPIILAHQIEK